MAERVRPGPFSAYTTPEFWDDPPRLRKRTNQSTPPTRAPMTSPKAKITPIVVNTCA